ncbi:Forkhead box protein H1 Forkhead activin signal transducer 1 [Channa argus]|uniref:Forkhead box protein H1 Forkhead activin signal transducer 1 n=1 Tax=Channa argus TaxID=215402 RepID=A0A6G1QZ88_CHAAH|nr:Forkhead box protein H1 Forkhead activin signal transducer 1 [Channa argus]KAK2921165.1 hypothetical protein Q8A73_000650 [Channa argus]
MQDNTEKPELRRATTHLARIAVALHNAPGEMLTFTQLMDKLAPLFREDRKSAENNIRVCLSTHKCFVKVPLLPDSPGSKRNYWKLDSSQITAKMVRRHFKGILQLFPELASRLKTENTGRPSQTCSALQAPEAAACEAAQIRREVKINSLFSIESILKGDSPAAQTCRASPLSSAPVGAEHEPWPTETQAGTTRSFRWDSEEPSAGSSPTCSTGGSAPYRLTVHGAAVPINMMDVCTEPSFPIYTRASAAPYFSSYSTYSAPQFTHYPYHFWL